MRITTTIALDRMASTLKRQSQDLDRTQQQVASGQKTRSPHQAPLQSVAAMQDQRSVRGGSQDQASGLMLASSLQQQDVVLAGMAQSVKAAQALLQNAGTADPAATRTELERILHGLVDLANSRDPQGRAYFAGQAATDTPFQHDSDGTVRYTGDSHADRALWAGGAEISTRLPGDRIFTASASGHVLKPVTDLLAVLKTQETTPDPAALRDATAAALDNLAAAQGDLSAFRAHVGVLAKDVEEKRLAAGDQISRSTERLALSAEDAAAAALRLRRQLTALEATRLSFVKLTETNLFKLL